MENSSLEYIIKQKTEGAVLLKKILLILGYITLFSVIAVMIFSLSAELFYIPFLMLDAAFCAMVAYVSWQFFCIEYELTLGGGELCMTVIYKRNIRRKKMSVAINSLIEFGIYDDEAYEKLSSMSLQKNYIAVSSMAAPIIYYAVFDEGKERCVLYFEADERAIKHLKQNNPGASRAGNIK